MKRHVFVGTLAVVAGLVCGAFLFNASVVAGGGPGAAPPGATTASAPAGTTGRGRGRGAAQTLPPATVPAEVAMTQHSRDNSAIRPTVGRGGRGGRGGAAPTDFDIMLLGDSITSLLTVADDGGGNPGGKSVMEKYLAGTTYANFGVPGDSTQGVLGRLFSSIGQGHKPKAIMLLIGTNNNGNTAEEIAEGVGADVWELRRDFPDAKILLMGIFPRGAGPTDGGRVRVAKVNTIIAKLADDKHVFFMDLTSKMVGADGKLIGFRPTDNLHPVIEGFDIWISNAAPLLKEWVK
jgi:lysophospholipase L1-like esterase